MSDLDTKLQSTRRVVPPGLPKGGSFDGVAKGLRQNPLANVGRRPSLVGEARAKKTDAEFYTRREQQELLLATSASDQRVRDVHYTLANAYRAKLDQLTLRRTG